jgi:hypothetical protein
MNQFDNNKCNDNNNNNNNNNNLDAHMGGGGCLPWQALSLSPVSKETY